MKKCKICGMELKNKQYINVGVDIGYKKLYYKNGEFYYCEPNIIHCKICNNCFKELKRMGYILQINNYKDINNLKIYERNSWYYKKK